MWSRDQSVPWPNAAQGTKSEKCLPQGSDPALLNPLAQCGDALDGVLAVAILVDATEVVAVQAATVKDYQRSECVTSPTVALLRGGPAHLRTCKLGQCGNASAMAFGPSGVATKPRNLW